MRICLYTSTALPTTGGQELVVDALARQFVGMGQQVVVLAPRPSRPWRLNDERLPYRVVRHPRFYSMRRLVEWYRWWLLGLCRREKIDLVHCHGLYPTGYLAGRYRDRLGLPLVLTSHGEDVYARYPRLIDPLLRQRHVEAVRGADALVAISRFTHEGYEQLCPEALRIVDIPNGVDVSAFVTPVQRPAELDPAIRSQDYVLFLGRLNRQKGVDVLLRAWAVGASERPGLLVIAGDGPARADLESLTAELPLGDRVRFVGWARGATKTYLLQNARLSVAPSRDWEAFGLVVLEAFAAGCPVVAANLPGLADLIEPGRTGWLVSPESVAELAAVLGQALADPAITDRTREPAREVARQYAWDRIARRHLELYESLCGR